MSAIQELCSVPDGSPYLRGGMKIHQRVLDVVCGFIFQYRCASLFPLYDRFHNISCVNGKSGQIGRGRPAESRWSSRNGMPAAACGRHSVLFVIIDLCVGGIGSQFLQLHHLGDEGTVGGAASFATLISLLNPSR